MSRMTMKILVVALALTAMALMSTSGFAQTCTTANFQFVGVGSSAQFNSYAYGALFLANGGSLPTGTNYNLWSSTNAILQDNRPTDKPTDTGVKLVVSWDNNTNCDVYAVFSTDSVVGVKDFFAYQKITEHGVTNADVAAVYASSLGTPGGQVMKAIGFPDTVTTALPAAISAVLNAQAGPSASSGPGSLPLKMCGQLFTTPGGNNKYCYFNAGQTDIRPEDALYATARALSAYTTTNSLAGLGYGQIGAAGCGAVSAIEGCPIWDALGQSSKFNVLSFALTGNDPFTGGGAVPAYSTLTTGMAPEIVFVSNADTSTGGFGSKVSGNYVYNDINRKVLGLIYEGTLHCTGDISPALNVVGKPIQVFNREPLSGTFNDFEFDGIRTLGGSAATAIGENKISSTTWISDDESGQQLDNNPALNYNDGTTGCPGNSNAAPDGSETCGDPMLIFTPSHPGISASSSGCGKGVRVGVVGSGEEVKAVRGGYTLPSAWFPAANDAMGYAFWSYQNFSGLINKTNCTGAGSSGNVVCTGATAHYLTVDGVDPFAQDEGAASLTSGVTAYDLPQCGGVDSVSGVGFPCSAIPFPHVFDGKYPLWAQLRVVTFENVVQNTNIGACTTPPCPTQQTPNGVANMVAAAQLNAVSPNFNLSDLVPFLTNVRLQTPSSCPTYNAVTNPNPVCYTGDLGIGVFRSHYLQSKVNPNNGHSACNNNFTAINLTGNTYNSTTKTTAGNCLVDSGGDMGGSVLTVQADVDFNLDFGSLFTADAPKYEIYGLHQ
jgi:hypothetical protein